MRKNLKSLPWIIENLKVGEIAKAEYAITEHWYITKCDDQTIRYCGANGENPNGLVPLTFSNIRAVYTVV